MRSLWLVPLALLMIPGVMAQDDGCTQSQPCPHFVDIDADGLSGDDLNATVGDWFSISFLNADGAAHTVTLSGYDLSWTVPAEDVLETDAFQLDETGTFLLTDASTDTNIMVRVFSNDVVDVETGADDPDYTDPDTDGEQGKGVPGPAMALVAIGLAAAARIRK